MSTNVTNVYSKKTKNAGNGLFASRDIPAGDLILLVNRPFLAVLDTPHLDDACSNCFVWVPQGGAAAGGDERDDVVLRACTGCKVVKYCGKVGSGLFLLPACLSGVRCFQRLRLTGLQRIYISF